MSDESTFNIYEAKTKLSQLIQKVLDGEKVIIAKSGNPLVELKKYEKPKNVTRFGGLENSVWMSDDFNETSPEILKMFGLKDDKDK